MKLEIKLDPAQTEPKLTLTAAALTDQLQELIRRLEGELPDPIPGWQGERMTPLEQWDILRCCTSGQKVLAQTADGGEYTLRLRLYELEQLLDPRRFVRVSNSEIVNLKAVTALDLSLSGTIKMALGNGETVYVSRRYVKRIKQAVGL